MKVPARSLAAALLAIFAFAGNSDTWGASLTWGVSSGDWSIASNWSGMVLPGTSDTAYIASGRTTTITQFGTTSGTLSLGSSGAGSGSVLMTAGGLSTTNYEYIGDSGIGSFTQMGGTNWISMYGFLYLGNTPSGSGAYTLGGNGLLSTTNQNIGYYGAGNFTQTGGTNSGYDVELGINGSGSGSYTLSGSGLLLATNNEYIGSIGRGSFMQLGGTNSGASDLEIGLFAGSSGSYSLSGSGLLSAQSEVIGDKGTGTFTQSGGTQDLSVNLDELDLGLNHSGSGALNLTDSGLLSVYTERVGYSGSGSFTQSGGTHAVSGSLVLAKSANSSGIYNLKGGLLLLSGSGLTKGSGNASFNFSGGTFEAGSSFSTSIPITLGSGGSGAVFDAAGGTLTLMGPLSGPGGFTERGAGLVILSGNNDYEGDTIVSAGTLEFASAMSLPSGTSLVVGAGAMEFMDGMAQGVPASDAAQAVPEPSALALLGGGTIGLIGCAWRRRRMAAICHRA